MSKEDKKNAALKKEIGRRFKEFRQAIKKSLDELAKESKIREAAVAGIEMGNSFPAVTLQNYLYHQYHMNLNWLLTGQEDMLISPLEKAKENNTPLLIGHIDESDPRFEKYMELLNLMRVPLIEWIILGRVVEIKVLAREEIKSFLG